jgi:DNA relaxase NicK
MGRACRTRNRRVIVDAGMPPVLGSNSRAAFVDYLNCTFPAPGSDPASLVMAAVKDAVGDAFGIMKEEGRGLHGYRRSFLFEHGQVRFALGGQNGTAMLSIPGEGCALVRDFAKLVVVFRDELGAHLTRLDAAHDDFEGRYGVDGIVQWYKEGRFGAGGRRPSCSQDGNWIEPDGSGRTFYVGKRENGKLYRGYEKGRQLGEPSSPWIRHEVEWHNVRREIPWDTVLEPGRYLAGAYPALSWVSKTATRIKTLRRTDAIVYEKATQYASLSYGQHISVMLKREGSAEAVVAKLARPGVPKRLALTERLEVHRKDEEESAE